MKRLFVVRNINTKKFAKLEGEVSYFEHKAKAKAIRRGLNGKTDDGTEKLSTGWVVARGPDHMGKHGQRHVTQHTKNRRAKR